MTKRDKAKLIDGKPAWRSIQDNDPKRLVKLISAGIELRNQRKELERLAKVLGDEEHEIEKSLLNDFDKADLQEVRTPLGVGRLVKKDIPVMDPDSGGWEAIYKYIVKHKAWEILTKRLGEKACQERWEAGEKIPGIKPFTKAHIKFGDAE
jgi:hypothetical protein